MNFLTIACVVLAFAGAILAEPVAIPGGGDLVGGLLGGLLSEDGLVGGLLCSLGEVLGEVGELLQNLLGPVLTNLLGPLLITLLGPILQPLIGSQVAKGLSLAKFTELLQGALSSGKCKGNDKKVIELLLNLCANLKKNS